MRRELLWGWTAELDGPPRELEWNQLLGILQDLKYLLYHSPVCQCPLSRETAIRGGDEVAPEIWGTCCVQRGSRCRLWRFGWNPFQDSRIRDYQWLPCHTVSIRNPQISRTRFVVDCSAFLPALGWLVAFCAAKAWRTNAHSLRSLGTQSREDRKREKEKSRRVYGESFFPVLRAGAPQWGTTESVSNLLPFEDFVSFSGSFFLCEFGLDQGFCCFGSDLESQSNLRTSIKSNQVYQFIKFHRPVMRCEMCWVPCVTSKDSSIRFLMSHHEKQW